MMLTLGEAERVLVFVTVAILRQVAIILYILPLKMVAMVKNGLVVSKNRTLPFSKACPKPLKNGQLSCITHQGTQEL